MASTIAPSTPDQPPKVQRSFTLPAKLSADQRPRGPERLPSGDAAVETLFTHPSGKIVSFSPSLTGLPKPRAVSLGGSIQNDELVGVLPWASHTERTMAAGPLRVYRVPGSVAFLNSGKTLHPILKKSQCWCVDGETKFVLRIRGHNYYRIELPNTCEEDRKAANNLKQTFAEVLQYETTACPFKRGFHVELPERHETPKRPWKPKHQPVNASPASQPPSSGDEGLISVSDQDASSVNNTDDEQRAPPQRDSVVANGAHQDIQSGLSETTQSARSPEKIEPIITAFEELKTPTALSFQRPVSNRSASNKATDSTTAIGSSVSDVRNIDNSANAAEASAGGSLLPFAGEPDKKATPCTSRSERHTPTLANGNDVDANSQGANSPQSPLEDKPIVPPGVDVLAVRDSPLILDNGSVYWQAVERPPSTNNTLPAAAQLTVDPPLAGEISVELSSTDETQQEIGNAIRTTKDYINSPFDNDVSSSPPSPPSPELPASDNTESSIIDIPHASLRRAGSSHTDASSASSSSEQLMSTPTWPDDASFKSSESRVALASALGDAKADASVDYPPSPVSSDDSSPRARLRDHFSRRRSHSPMPSSNNLYTPRHHGKGYDITTAVLQRTASIMLVPPARLVALMLKIAARLANGAVKGESSVSTETGRRIPCSWDSDGDEDSITSGEFDEDDYGNSLVGGSTLETRPRSRGAGS